MNTTRRGVLAGFAALPVMARTAAEKAGLTAAPKALSAANGIGPHRLFPAAPPTDHATYLKSQIMRVLQGETRRDYLKHHQVSRLDPDLASSRSLSLSAAMMIQRERDAQRYVKERLEECKKEFKQFCGLDWSPD